jgi:hypothetical protein
MGTNIPIARHADAARSGGGALVGRWLRQGKVWLLPLLLSDYGRDLIYRKYDAIATDRAYSNTPSGKLGVIGKTVDRIVLRQDIHEGLRQRLAIVVEELATAVEERWADGVPTVRLVSGPCGLARDLRLLWRRLDAPSGRLTMLGLDLDQSGEVLPLASRLARAAGVPLLTGRCDLLDRVELGRYVGERPADVFLSIGLTVWLDAPDLGAFLERLHGAIAPGGTLVIDNFHSHGASRFAADLEMKTRYHAPAAFEQALQRAGFTIIARRGTSNGVNSVYRCRKTAQRVAGGSARSAESERR